MNYKHVSACPRCGAPVYEERDSPVKTSVDFIGELNIGGPPIAYFTCDCRKALAPPLPDDVLVEPESTEVADARFLASQRPEAPSEERAE